MAEKKKRNTDNPPVRERQKKKGVEIDLKVGNELWRISGTLRSWDCGPVVKNKKTGVMEHKPEFYYSSLEGVLNGMAERALRLSPATSFEELRVEAKRIKEEFKGYYDLHVGEGKFY